MNSLLLFKISVKETQRERFKRESVWVSSISRLHIRFTQRGSVVNQSCVQESHHMSVFVLHSELRGGELRHVPQIGRASCRERV